MANFTEAIDANIHAVQSVVNFAQKTRQLRRAVKSARRIFQFMTAVY
jgi:hypothetical protein